VGVGVAFQAPHQIHQAVLNQIIEAGKEIRSLPLSTLTTDQQLLVQSAEAVRQLVSIVRLGSGAQLECFDDVTNPPITDAGASNTLSSPASAAATNPPQDGLGSHDLHGRVQRLTVPHDLQSDVVGADQHPDVVVGADQHPDVLVSSVPMPLKRSLPSTRTSTDVISNDCADGGRDSTGGGSDDEEDVGQKPARLSSLTGLPQHHGVANQTNRRLTIAAAEMRWLNQENATLKAQNASLLLVRARSRSLPPTQRTPLHLHCKCAAALQESLFPCACECVL
jgi:hypothetical protein